MENPIRDHPICAMKKPNVLITRPLDQHKNIESLCRSAGFCVTLLPCIEIVPVAVDSACLENALATHEHVLFTSANAVHHAHRLIDLPWPNNKVHAIGNATAQVLGSYGQALFANPQAPFNSEQFVRLRTSQPAASLLIIKGQGGRNHIHRKLTELDWQVSTQSVYARIQPEVSPERIRALFDHQASDVVSVTSDENLLNLMNLCRPYIEQLRETSLVVNSQRCANLAVEQGFREHIMVADPPGDAGQLACLKQWKERFWDGK